ncbi:MULTISPECIES: Eco57I restriction-modification methylase domain-containing protein [unclassified Microcoleus]|uniref:Eco57I restriction-modification methylase domain-containing protein n=1 Tax=unclassified Microcoleus TaxID=2642155 RepID=UPI002FD13EE7
MSERLLQLDDLRTIDSPEKIASMFRKLGYVAETQPLNIEDLQLSARNTEAITETYLIANQGNAALQVLLFQLEPNEWVSPSTASTRMKAIASQLGKRATEFLLLATKDYNQLMLVNPRKTLDEKMNVKASIRKLLIDRTNPTAYDRDRLEAIAAKNQTPLELYKTQCEAFDVEKLTKQFYRGYKELFDRVQAAVKKHNPHSYFNDSDCLHQFSQRLLGRVMFLYFLQKKEFLAGDRRFLTKQYEPFRTKPDDTNYYGEVLEPLFFETLNAQRPNFESRWGKIPYLNGGLFDRDYGAGIRDAAGRETPETITLPNSLFDPGSSDGILGFFNNYNFTVSENVAGDEDVAVDPEMLGKVFENMLAAEERGQSGTFYTPRGIVQFMCAEVLTRYLVDESGMDLDAVRQFVEYDPDLSDADFNQLMSPQQARSLKKAVENIKVLDPAVGSGAFPLGMMQTILQVRQAIARREGITVQRGSLTMSEWKREIIGNNLYGVDIKPESIEIAKLRMWLSLVVDIPNIDNVEPLPNLDYKLMCGNSLISTIYGEQLIPDPTKTQQGMLAVTPIQMAIAPLLELEKRYFDAQSDERHQLREKILAAEANIFRVAVIHRRQFWLGKQKELEDNIRLLKGKVTKPQEKEMAEIVSKLAELDKFAVEVESGERSLNFFQYHLHFRDVFEGKGGFDIVIGNPPYVGQKSNKEIFQNIRSSFLGKFYQRNMDIFYFFYHLGLEIIREDGLVSFITTNYFLTADGAFTLRQDLKERSVILRAIDFNELRIFESAKGQHNLILCLQKSKNVSAKPIKANITIVKRKGDADFNILNSILNGIDSESSFLEKTQSDIYQGSQNYIRLSGVDISFTLDSNNVLKKDKLSIQEPNISSILDKISQKSNFLLGQICEINTGIQTGCDKVTEKHIQQGLIDYVNKDKGVYVLSKEEILNLCLVEHEKQLIKPFYKNSDIRRYYCNIIPQRFLIYATRELDINKYSNIYRHFIFYEKIVKSRSYNRGEIQAALKQGKWWVVFQQKSSLVFEGEKVICPQRSSLNCFAYNNEEWYSSKDVYFITLKHSSVLLLKYLLAVLNSRMYYYWLYFRGKRKGDNLELYYTPLTEIPIYVPEFEKQKEIIEVVNKIMDTKKLNPHADIAQDEVDIDNMIAHLYGLTDQEMKIIRSE